MVYLTIRTDNPQAELGVYKDAESIDEITWSGHRRLAETLHGQMLGLLARNGLSLADIGGIVCFKGPGSFTGLRIGISVANALAYSLQVPISAQGGTGWEQGGIRHIQQGADSRPVMPDYGAEVHITPPKH